MNTPIAPLSAGQGGSGQAEVTRRIALDIITGHYAEGDTLPRDAELSAIFNVSRTVLRESIKTLSAKGLLIAKAKVGTRVRERSAWNMFDSDLLGWHLEAGIDRRFVRDLTEIRLAVEPQAAALAAKRRTAEMVSLMRESIQKMRDAPSDSLEFANADLQLHLDIAIASGNPFMRSIGAVIEAALRATFRLSAPAEDRERQTAIDAHALIVDAIENAEPSAAAEAMRQVIYNGLRRHGVSIDD